MIHTEHLTEIPKQGYFNPLLFIWKAHKYLPKTKILFTVLFHTSPIIEAEISETFSPQDGLNTFYYVPNKRNMSHFAKKCNGFHFYPNIKKPELS